MKQQRSAPFLGAGLIAALLGSGVAGRAETAPLHPDLLRDGNAQALRIPPEPAFPRGGGPVQGTAATREGRTWTGHPRLLVLLVDFEDRPADRAAHPPEYYRRLLFSENAQQTPSLREWYLDATHGKIAFDGEVFGWYRMPAPYSQYANGQSGLCNACYPNNADAMVVHAFQAASAGIDLSEFDNDGPDGIPGSGDDDGILDGLAVVFAGSGAERTGQLEDIRSHYGQTVLDLGAGGVRAPDYVAFPELENVGVAVHEIGHLLGAEDLYDLSSRGNGLGYYSVMAYGLWFNNAREPGGPDPYTRMLWNVLEPEIIAIDEPGVNLEPIDAVPRALRLWTRGEAGPEYFLVEYRRRIGIDRFLFGDGLLLYHVNESAGAQSAPGRYLVSLVQADGLGSLEGEAPRNLGEFGDYFPGLQGIRGVDDETQPSTRSRTGAPTGVAIRNIEDPGPLMRFDVAVGNYLAGEPRPVLFADPPGGGFGGGVLLGRPQEIRLRVVNRGTRLPEGRLQVFSRDPAIRIEGTAEFEVASLGALQAAAIAMPVRIEVAADVPGSRPLVPIEARWESGDAAWNMMAPVVLSRNLAAREAFEDSDGAGESVSLAEGAETPWTRRAGGGYGGTTAWTTSGYGPNQDAVVVWGPVDLAGGVSEVRFRQRVNLHAFGEYAYDGGFLEISDDDGASWQELEPAGGYPYTFGFSEGNPHFGTGAWSGAGEGWEEVTVPVPHSGRVLLRFHFASDFTASGEVYGGWTVDDLVVRTWERTHVIFAEPPRRSGGGTEFRFEIRRPFEAEVVSGIDLVREAGASETVLGSWNVSERLDQTITIPDPSPWQVERLWFRFGSGDRVGPILLGENDARGGLLAANPGTVSRAGEVTLHYRVPGSAPSHVTLDLHDLRGARVARLVEGVREPGSHRSSGFPGGTGRGLLGSGVYFLRLAGEGFEETRRIVLLP